ncbi:hypothetical protein BDF20DRAFT_831590 [Mycotypha africana]|uniref:uncharacterized protein n=1 Tax=Mycotypha africana TaxID=64632 RepID=UPI002300CA94|nr:uncharacterized protein BDF20DRAFT_831590 [Mycotypha africana]KAI8991559.1 hypothetical protein BDF20DRAFT_831590 [Mycotypha africana]
MTEFNKERALRAEKQVESLERELLLIRTRAKLNMKINIESRNISQIRQLETKKRQLAGQLEQVEEIFGRYKKRAHMLLEMNENEQKKPANSERTDELETLVQLMQSEKSLLTNGLREKEASSIMQLKNNEDFNKRLQSMVESMDKVSQKYDALKAKYGKLLENNLDVADQRNESITCITYQMYGTVEELDGATVRNEELETEKSELKKQLVNSKISDIERLAVSFPEKYIFMKVPNNFNEEPTFRCQLYHRRGREKKYTR